MNLLAFVFVIQSGKNILSQFVFPFGSRLSGLGINQNRFDRFLVETIGTFAIIVGNATHPDGP